MATPGLDLAFITVDDNKVTTDLERIKAWSLLIQTTYETAALPANPVDGQEVYFAADATNGVIWHLRYRAAASGSYKWEFLGGPPLEAQTGTTVRTTASTSYVAPATDPMSVTLTHTGSLNIIASAQITHSKLANTSAGSLLMGNGSGVITSTAMSGDVTINSSGVTAIGASKVRKAMTSLYTTMESYLYLNGGGGATLVGAISLGLNPGTYLLAMTTSTQIGKPIWSMHTGAGTFQQASYGTYGANCIVTVTSAGVVRCDAITSSSGGSAITVLGMEN